MCVGVGGCGSGLNLASFPGSRVEEEEREPGTHCSHMHQVILITCILLCYIKTRYTHAHHVPHTEHMERSKWQSGKRCQDDAVLFSTYPVHGSASK